MGDCQPGGPDLHQAERCADGPKTYTKPNDSWRASPDYRPDVHTNRLEFLFGPEAADIVNDYDLAVESDRMELVEEFLPFPAGSANRGSRMAVRTVAVTQIITDAPPETWQTVERLRELGLDRDAILGQISMVIADQLSVALEERAAFDVAAYGAALAELPLPTADAVELAAIEAACVEPGVDLGDLFEGVVSSLSPSRSRLAERLVDMVVDSLIDGPLHLLPNDGVVYVPGLVAGRTFTHRLNDAEAELEVVTAAIDLGAFTSFDEFRLPDGSDVVQFSADRGHVAWRGPDGWLAAFAPGDLLSVTVDVAAPAGEIDGVRGGGIDEPMTAIVHIAVVSPEPVMTAELVDAVRAAYGALTEELDLPVTGDQLALWLCFHRSALFSVPQLPLDELCATAGLEQRGGFVAHDESVWQRDLAHQRFDEVSALVPESRWRLALGRAFEVLDDPGASAGDVRQAMDECAADETLDVLADVLFPHYLDVADASVVGRSDAPGRLFELVDRALAVARRPRETATAEYLAAVLYERCAAPHIAEEHLIRAAAAHPQSGPVVERMGWYRFDRGDAQGAMKWWRRLSELPPAASTIESVLAANGAPRLGRNDPCWCGSGRKFKHCHLGSSSLPALPDRVAWLCRKASLWLEHTTGESRAVVAEMATARALADPDADPYDFRDFDDDEAADLLKEAMADPIVFDAALHEGRLFHLFLHERGALLPDDEQLLAASWLTVNRSVHEVVAVERGVSLTLRDLATGDIVDVRERTASRSAETGERYCARVVPDGESHQIIGGVFPVRAGHESTVLDLCAEGDGAALCAWVGALYRPPRLVHSPGLIDSMFDREKLETMIADLGDDVDEATMMAALNAELARQAQAGWLDEHIPALGGLTPREAAADPTRRELLERLLDEFDRNNDALDALAGAPGTPEDFRPFSYDVTDLRRELGLL